MSGAYIQARMNRVSSNPRKTLRAPERSIALQEKYITNSKTTLVITPQGDAESAAAFKIQDDGVTLFTVSGRKFGGRSYREFYDDTGLPLFELRKKLSLSNSWSVTLPGNQGPSLAIGAPRVTFGTPISGNFNITFDNAAALDSKRPGEKALTLMVERHGNILESFDIIDGDRKVAEIRESIHHNQKIALRASSRRNYQPTLDAIVAPGVDLSLVVVIAVIASDSVFGTD